MTMRSGLLSFLKKQECQSEQNHQDPSSRRQQLAKSFARWAPTSRLNIPREQVADYELGKHRNNAADNKKDCEHFPPVRFIDVSLKSRLPPVRQHASARRPRERPRARNQRRLL